MAGRDANCPRCHASYPWGTTVCPACHIGLDLPGSEARERPSSLIFESWDRPSVDVVVALLEVHGVPCLVRGSENSMHFGIGPASFWRIFVPASDEQTAQEILDAEIGRDDVEGDS